MKRLLPLLLLFSATSALPAPPQKASRQPLQKKQIVLEAPKNYAQRILRYDKQTGQPVHYDPKPRVAILDHKSGKYALKWIGYDGKEKTVIYQRPNAIDALVSARVANTPSGKFLYIYKIENLATSGQELSTFVVQGFATDVQPLRTDSIYAGPVSKNETEFRDGSWLGFAPLNSSVLPGRSVEFRLESSAAPGLVECRLSGGARGMKGAGEDMPQELEDVLPGYEVWPSGYTIGPVQRLNAMPANKRANYIRKKLAEFQRLGWIVADLVPWYEQNLKTENLEQAVKQATADFREGKITSELLAMIESRR